MITIYVLSFCFVKFFQCNIEQREYTSAAVWLRKADDLPAISQDVSNRTRFCLGTW